MDPPGSTVVIPAFNSAWSIGRTIASVLAQTWRDFELIVVDDGSTDNVAETVAAFAEADPRVRMVRQANRGLARARNRGIEEARSDAVALIDADDLWHPRFLEKLVAALEECPDAPFAYAFSFRVDIDDRLIASPPWKKTPRHDFVGLLTVNSVGNGSAALYRREALLAVGGFDETLKLRDAQGAEDWKLCLQLAARGQPVLVPEYLVGYRLVETGMSQAQPARQLHAIRTVISDIRSQFPDVPERHFVDARTMMTGWLLPAFARQGQLGTILKLLITAYGGNPLWFRSRDLRNLHIQKLTQMGQGLMARVAGRSGAAVPLSALTEDGELPFGYLAEDVGGPANVP